MSDIDKAFDQLDKRLSRELEKTVEAKFCARLKRQSDYTLEAIKFTSPSRRSDPDRMILNNFANDARVAFVELKRSKEKPTKAQAKRHRELRDKGYLVLVCAGSEQIDDTIDQLLLYFTMG